MRAACSKPNSGLSLIELMVASSLMALISVAAFFILAEGGRYLAANQMAVDAQRSGLAILSALGADLQASKANLIVTGPQGVVLASPFDEERSIEFDLASSTLKWQSWICYEYDGTSVSKKVRRFAATASPTSPPAPSSFAGDRATKILGKEITRFEVSPSSSTPNVWSIRLTAGSMQDSARYGIELESEAGPRN